MAMDIGEYLDSLPVQQGFEQYTNSLGKVLGRNPVPALWRAFGPAGERLINREYLSRLRSGAEGLAEGRRRLERDLFDSFTSSGIDPLLAKAYTAESGYQLGEDTARLQGDLLGQRYEDLFNLYGGITNALGESYGTERSALLQAYQAAKARDAARKGAQSAGLSSLLGAGIGALGTALGGPLGGALASSLFSATQGSGGAAGGIPGMTSSPYYPVENGGYGPYVPR